MKQLNSNKTRFTWFYKILVIYPIAEVYGESNERQLCSETAAVHPKTSNAHWQILERRLLKRLWEKTKMLVTSIFVFFQQCFLPCQRKSA